MLRKYRDITVKADNAMTTQKMIAENSENFPAQQIKHNACIKVHGMVVWLVTSFVCIPTTAGTKPAYWLYVPTMGKLFAVEYGK